MTQLALELAADHIDVPHLGYIERRPEPARPIGMPVGYRANGSPIYRPAWADYQWFATWVAASDLANARLRKYTRFTHLRICQGRNHSDPLDPKHIDWRDSLATMRDIWAGFEAEGIR